jgi:hypothetical protein
METLTTSPYINESFNKIYELLFCDNPELYRPAKTELSEYPWNVLFADKPSVNDLQNILQDEEAETRVKLLAHRILKPLDEPENGKELLGVIVEVGLDEGLDTLAAYQDGTARYINHAEKVIIWDMPDNKSIGLINGLFTESLRVVKQIGPWNGERLNPPAKGDVRLTFLVGGDIYFGQGPFEVLAKDALGGPVIHAATQLMIHLTETKHS